MISILLPSRSRPQRALETARKWLSTAGCDVEFLLSIDVDDPLKLKYLELFPTGKILCYDNRSAIDAINRAAKESKGNVIIQIAEDFEPCDNWGMKILRETQGKEDWILKTQDGIQSWLITLPILDRKYYDRFGYIYYPEYLHMFCDTELSCVADLTGRRLTSNLLFPHNHYSTGKSVKDSVSAKADLTWNQGDKLFKERFRKNFDLRLCDLGGKIQDQGMINYARS